MATLFSSVLCILILFQLTAADDCQTTNSPCKANCGGENVDLSHMLKYPYTVSDNTPFYINPCEAVECDSIQNVAVCQDSNNKKFNCGLINDTTWSVVSTSSPFTVTVSFNGGRTPTDGNTRISQITIIKVNNVSSAQLIYVNEESSGNTNTYYFTIYTNNLAPSSSGGNIIGPIGLTLILLAIVGLVTYFIVGALIMYFVKGARGVEIIPNLGFWKSLPFLVKDGCLFVISPCYKRGSYEKI